MEYADVAAAQSAADQFKTLLGLTQWTIRVQFSDDLQGSFGKVGYALNKHSARISLLSRSGFESWRVGKEDTMIDAFDQERTLIHEITHLHLAPLDPLIEDNKLSEQIVENAVHALSVAIQQLLDVARKSSSLLPDIQSISNEEVIQ